LLPDKTAVLTGIADRRKLLQLEVNAVSIQRA
jgi:hypothetical protein